MAARVPFMPTSQSASPRERAAALSGAISEESRRCSKPSRMASLVIDDTHSRLTGLSIASSSRMYSKISSPSRPASQPLTISSTSLRLASLRSTSSCFLPRPSIGFRWNSSGMIGSRFSDHSLYLGS